MDDAPWAPVFNEQRYVIHSPRIGGSEAMFLDPVRTPLVNYEHVYATDGQ